jgi:hypothetical protein
MDYDSDTSFLSVPSATQPPARFSFGLLFEYASHTGRTAADILSILRLKDAAMQELFGRVSFYIPPPVDFCLTDAQIYTTLFHDDSDCDNCVIP